MAQDFLERLKAGNLTVSVAESCTGGLLGAAITSIPGSSASFRGGVLAYHNDVKRDVLGVPAKVLANQGAVSASAVEAMAHGVRDAFHTDVAIAVSGVAGPSGGSDKKPVGTVWIAVLGPADLLDVHKFHFDGDRDDIRRDAVQKCLELAQEACREASHHPQASVAR